MREIENFNKSLVELSDEDTFVVYTKSGCCFCEKTIDLLRDYEENYVKVDLGNSPDLIKSFKEDGFKTVPQIYFVSNNNIEYIGGYLKLVDWLN